MNKKIAINSIVCPNRAELYALFDEILDSKQITNNGPFVNKFEAELLKVTSGKYGLTCCNGTIGLHLAIKALKLKGEIITTPFTFIATCSSIIWENCTPVFVDIDQDTFCLDPSKIEEKITPKTVAILPVHIYGNSCDVDAIDAIGKRHNVKVIYDAAQAFGTKANGKFVLSHGDISVVSLHSYKIVSSIEGGAIFCNDKSIYDELFKLRCFGKSIDNVTEMVGINAKMNEFSAAFGILSLQNFEFEMQKRTDISIHYRNSLGIQKDFQFQESYDYTTPNNAYFPLIFPNEKYLLKALKKCESNNIECRRYFYPTLSEMEFIKSKYPGDTPIANNISERVLCLPINSELNEASINKVAKTILSVM